MLGKEAGKNSNWRTSRDHPIFSLIKTGRNTVMNAGDLKRFDITRTPEKDSQLTLVRKTHKEYYNYYYW